MSEVGIKTRVMQWVYSFIGSVIAFGKKGGALFLPIAGIFILLPDAASAGEISGLICNLVDIFTGTAAKAIATLAVMAIGYAALLGKGSWGWVFAVCAGIGVVFGTANLATTFLGQGVTCTPPAPFNFSCNGTTANGNLFDLDTLANSQGACTQTQIGQQAGCGIFAYALSMYKNTVGTIMSSMYCGITGTLRGPLAAAMTLFVTVFGIMIATGLTNFTIKEASAVLFKIALIWMFATDSDWAIGVAYRFFMDFAEEGSNIVLNAMPHGAGPAATLTEPDAIITSVLNTTGNGQGQQVGALQQIPQVCLLYLALMALVLLFFMPVLLIFRRISASC